MFQPGLQLFDAGLKVLQPGICSVSELIDSVFPWLSVFVWFSPVEMRLKIAKHYEVVVPQQGCEEATFTNLSNQVLPDLI